MAIAAAPPSRTLSIRSLPGREDGLTDTPGASSYQCVEARDRVGFGGRLVGADPADSGEPHRQPRLVSTALVDRIECDFEHQRLLDLADRPEALNGVASHPAVE